VLLHWAREKIKLAKGSKSTDEQLHEAILQKFKGVAGVKFAEVARHAAEMCRPNLATMLLNHEPRGHAQVTVLLHLSREGDDESRLMMLRLALDKACQSYDPDLLYGVVSVACGGGDPFVRGVPFEQLVALIKEKPQGLNMMADYVASQLRIHQQFDSARSFHEKIGRLKRAAENAVMQVFTKCESQERRTWLRNTEDAFKKPEQELRESDRMSMVFGAQATNDEAELLRLQEDFEIASVQKNWLRGPHRFVGLPLVDTLRKLIDIGEVVEADKVQRMCKISDKRYWRIKVRALSDADNIPELQLLAENRTSPIGYDVFVDAFIKHRREDLAKPFVPKIKDFQVQAEFYKRMGMEEEAQNALQMQDKQTSGLSGLFDKLLRPNV